MSQVGSAISEIISALSPLADAGVLVRSVPDNPNAVGRLEINGTITVAYEGDTDFSIAQNLGGLHQNFISQFAVVGRLKNLKGAQGFYAMRDLIYQLTVGLSVSGYYQPLRAIQFQPTGPNRGRQETSWDFVYLVGAPGVRVACTDHPGLGEAVEGAADLTEIFFNEPEVVAVP